MIKLSFTQFKKYLSRSIHPAFPLVVMILLCFVILQIIITYFPVTMPFLGHSYILLIALSTFWFGLEGGFLTATLASALHFANLRITHREILDAAILNSLYTIFLIYYLCGTILGYISGKQNRLKDEFKKLAQYDELTGCLNFRWTMRILEQELAACQRY
ncbi:MAG: hypothetical protein PHO30_04980, partial [Candidatus Omnitrophica bacterium]|nr:hypothetical protein [Candidatus Omnitrophota bacterium]